MRGASRGKTPLPGAVRGGCERSAKGKDRQRLCRAPCRGRQSELNSRDMTDSLIRDVSDTAFWIAQHRAHESARADALFRDPLAARLAGERGAKIAAAMPNSRMIGWSVAIRTRIIDDCVLRAVGEGIDTVLNLGAGLDTRPYRMNLPSALHWIEADYARIVEYKEIQLAWERPRCGLERVKIDLADRTARCNLLARVDARARRVLVLTEGVVPYLSVEQAALLADDLRAMDRACRWLVDYFSPQAMKYRKRTGMGRMIRNAPFLFAPADWFGFFGQHGWRAKEVHYLAEEGERLKRPIPLPWPAQAVSAVARLFMSRERHDALRRFAGYVVLEPR
jgi:methyltransferase (TIGR00027 family)